MVVWFTIYKIDVSGRKCGENVFWKNLAPAGFKLGTYGTASHHGIIQPWNQHSNLQQ